MARSYLDHNATAPVRPEVVDACARALSLGNPSSVHAEGRAARAAVEAARAQVAAFVGAEPKNVIFTSGGTEANNLALSPALRRTGGPPPTRLLVGGTEHASVLDGHRFPANAAEPIPVDGDGVVDLAWLEARLRDGPALASIQVANSETGVIQPVAAAAALVRAAGGLLHADAVQAAGRIPLDIAALGADLVTLSAHKLGGPKGVGALVVASDAILLDRLVRGGGQERGQRGGTENISGIVGFGAAAQAAGAAVAAEGARLRALRDACEAAVRRLAPAAVVFGEGAERLSNTLCFAVPGVKAETALIAFDLAGVAVSSGSACSSGKVGRSHVLAAMGVPPALAEGAIRVSFGWSSAEEDVARFAAAFEKLLAALYVRRADAA